MKRILIIGTIMMMTPLASADVTGVSSKISLLQQLQINLGITVQQMRLPEQVVSKLPVTNDLEEVRPSFLAAWTQTTFLACKRSIQSNKIPQLEKEEEIKNWIKNMTISSWGEEASKTETDELFSATFTKNPDETPIHKMSLLCSLILSSPKVYFIY